MTSKMVAAASAALLTAAVMATTPAFSQDSELIAEVSVGLSELGFMTENLENLTDEQAAEIKNVLDSTDDDETKKMAIEALMAE